MKHFIAFLGYSQSRIQHPVYRQFIQVPVNRRNATLLFQSRPLEEREIVHEVNEFRKRENGPCEVTFHLCASLDIPNMGEQLVQTLTLIRRLYDCPSLVYCYIPDLDTCSEEQRKTAWKSLVLLNNLVTDYPSMTFMSHCFLYHDSTHRSLANFLFAITQQPESMEELSRCGFIGRVRNLRQLSSGPNLPEFPSIFSTFNTAGINYPEEEIRYYIQQSILSTLLDHANPENNPVNMEQCNIHVQQILHALPLSDSKITLCDDSFISLPDENSRIWPKVKDFWTAEVKKVVSELNDLSKDLWLKQLRNTLDVVFESRYRETGVELFYSRESGRTEAYCQILLTMFKENLIRIMERNPYAPRTSQDIIRSFVNLLQQESIAFTKKYADANDELSQLQDNLEKLESEWNAMGFIDRMRGRDKDVFEQYQQQILHFYILLTQSHGWEFATKLLNEFIPQVAALSDDFVHLDYLCLSAADFLSRYLEDNTPESICPSFPVQPIYDTISTIKGDKEYLVICYKKLVNLLYSSDCPTNSDSLLQQLHDLLDTDIDHYIFEQIDKGSLPPILDEDLINRIADIYVGRGGFKAFLDNLKKQTALSLKIKEKSRQNEQYLLIAPDGEGVGPHIKSIDSSSLQMIHLQTGISLQDLEGFTGQRMFVEPSIF